MPVSQLWAVLFFIMLLLLGVDSQFATLEGFITVMRDIPYLKKLRKELLVGMHCVHLCKHVHTCSYTHVAVAITVYDLALERRKKKRLEKGEREAV